MVRGHGLPAQTLSRYQRPLRGEYGGVNWSSPQARGLVAWFPLDGFANKPQLEVLKNQRSSQLGASVVNKFDPMLGVVQQGNGNGSGSSTISAIQFPGASYTKVSTYVALGQTWGYSFWWRSRFPASGINEYLLSYNGPTSPWPGTAISFDTSNQLACNTNNSSLGDQGKKSTMNPMDGKWHHCLFTQTPSGNPATASSHNVYYIDGKVDSIHLNGAAQAGDPGSVNMYFNGNDTGIDATWSGWLTDFRIYAGNWLKSEASPGGTNLGLAQHLYRLPTRWDLYRTSSTMGMRTTAAEAALTGTALSGFTESDVVAGGDTIVITLNGTTWIPN